MRVRTRITGLRDIESACKYIKTAVSGALEEISVLGAYVIENEAKELCPIDTGTLRRSIHHETTEKTATRANVAIGPNTPYARRLEYGFVGKDSLGRNYNQAPQPYMRPAFDGKQDEARQEMRSAAEGLIKEAVIEAYNHRAEERRR